MELQGSTSEDEEFCFARTRDIPQVDQRVRPRSLSGNSDLVCHTLHAVCLTC